MQLPSVHSRSRVHSRSLERRLVAWESHRIEVPYQYFVTGAYVNLLFQHTVQRLQAEGPSIPLRSSPSSSLSSSIDASGTRCLDEPLSRVVSHRRVWWLPLFLWFFSFHSRFCSLGPRSRRITDNERVWSSPPSLGITEAKSARIPAIVDACPP
eukprot:g15035.t1